MYQPYNYIEIPLFWVKLVFEYISQVFLLTNGLSLHNYVIIFFLMTSYDFVSCILYLLPSSFTEYIL